MAKKKNAVVPLWPGSSVATSRGVLHVRRAAHPGGEPAVMVHGLSGSAGNWTDLMSELDGFDSHAPDLPGFGRSAPPRDGRYGLDTHVSAVTAYIEEHVGRPVHLFGNSLGGATAIRLAAEHPDLVRTLTLISPAVPVYRVPRDGSARLALMVMPGSKQLLAAQLARATPEQRARRLLDLVYAHPEKIAPQRLVEFIAETERRSHLPWMAPALNGSLHGLIRAYVDPRRSLWKQAAQVSAPVLHIHGAKDRLVPVGVTSRSARTFRDCRVLVVEEVGHAAQIEAPQVVANAFLEMLDEARALPA